MNQTQPLVTVVIPMYNVASFIDEALDSVLNQSYENIEVLCIDDGSPDGSSTLVEARKDPRVRVIYQQNRGLAGARNTGLNAAQGEYIALLDADDLWHQDKLKAHVEHLEQNKDVDISYCPSLFMDEKGELLTIGQFPKLKGINAKDILCRNPVGNGSAAVIRKNLLLYIRDMNKASSSERVEYFDERLRQSEDIEFWLRCALKYYAKFEGIPDAFTYYRINEDGLSANLDKQLASWFSAMNYNAAKHCRFFSRWFSLAEAYQYRYLARRAIKSGMKKEARKYCFKALKTNILVLFEEPLRTINTLGCMAFMHISPKGFDWISQRVMAGQKS